MEMHSVFIKQSASGTSSYLYDSHPISCSLTKLLLKDRFWKLLQDMAHPSLGKRRLGRNLLRGCGWDRTLRWHPSSRWAGEKARQAAQGAEFNTKQMAVSACLLPGVDVCVGEKWVNRRVMSLREAGVVVRGRCWLGCGDLRATWWPRGCVRARASSRLCVCSKPVSYASRQSAEQACFKVSIWVFWKALAQGLVLFLWIIWWFNTRRFKALV